MAARNVHQRLQEYIECYVEADVETDLARFAAGDRGAADNDPTETGLKALALALLVAIERRALKISVGTTEIGVWTPERSTLAEFPADVLETALCVDETITGLD